jgi:hypothetical protein
MAPEPLVEAADEAVPKPHSDVGQAPVWDPDQTLADEPLVQDETLVLEEGLAFEEGPIFEESLFSEESPVTEGSISVEDSIFEEALLSDKVLVKDEDLNFDEAEGQAWDEATTLDDEPAAPPQETTASRRIPSFLEQSDGNSLPDWLEDDDGSFEGDFYEEQAPAEPEFRIVEATTHEMEPLPDWLAEEPTQEWVESGTAAAGHGAGLDETAGADTDEVDPVEGVAEAKGKRPNRNLEILLFSLVVLAVIIVAALAYVIIVQPAF